MSALQDKDLLIAHWTRRVKELLQDRSNLDADDLAYVAEKAGTMRDDRLGACITELIGWGTEERAELETFCAIAIELMRYANPSTIRAAARVVEIKHLMKEAR